MTDTSGFDNDHLEQFLSGPPPSIPGDSFKQRLLLQSTRLLRRRRRFKQYGYVAALVACYAAGLGTVRLIAPAEPTTEHASGTLETVPKIEAVVKTEPPTSAPGAGHEEAVALEQDPEVPAVVLERIAAQSEDKQASLFRYAGDRYLQAEGDTRAA